MKTENKEQQTLPQDGSRNGGAEKDKWLDALEFVLESVLKERDSAEAPLLLSKLATRLRDAGVDVPATVATPYINTIPSEKEPPYPGDREIERRIKSYIRWNAMAMVVKANRLHSGLGGHISTYASSATLYEVAFNHFFRGGDDGRPADMVYFQGHAVPGIYARAFLEGRLDAEHLHNFRQELAEGGGLSSYPHPYLMPEFWQFPTVSMGLGPIMSIYQARFNRYLQGAGILKGEDEPRVWAFLGDGETDEPESLGALGVASREHLDNLIWVDQLQPAAAGRTGPRQRQDHPGAGTDLPGRRMECDQGDLGIRLGSAAGGGHQGASAQDGWKKRSMAIIRSIPSRPAAIRASISSGNIRSCSRWSTT